jgi:hypothetical protein
VTGEGGAGKKRARKEGPALSGAKERMRAFGGRRRRIKAHFSARTRDDTRDKPTQRKQLTKIAFFMHAPQLHQPKLQLGCYPDISTVFTTSTNLLIRISALYKLGERLACSLKLRCTFIIRDAL